MQVDNELTKKIATLSRLKLTEEEVEEFTQSLQSVTQAFSKIQEVDTEGIAISMQPVELKNIMREDEPITPLTNEEATSQTSLKQDHYFKGPKVV